MVVQLEHVAKTYRTGDAALEDVSLTVRQGEFVSVIGSSGAGKTTLLRLINGAEKPTAGRVFVGGGRFDTKRGKAKRAVQRRIATVFQDFCLVEESTCLQNVLNAELSGMPFWKVLAGAFSAEQKKRACAALEQVGLKQKILERVANLSGGQKQRVAIARAVMQNPVLILADEPVAALDPVSARLILQLLKGLQKNNGISVLMNCHNVAAALENSDTVIGLKDGRVLFAEPPEHITDAMLKNVYAKHD